MKSRIRHLLFVLPLALCPVLVGCAADAGGGDDDVAGDAPEVNATAPITLANYLTHPKIVAIRNEAKAIDDGHLPSEDNPGCDGTISKLTGSDGKIYQIFEQGGEGGFEGETRAYYRENGKLLFIFDKESDLTGESGQNEVTKESRIYFDEQGRKIWQVVRAPGGADRLPTGNEVYQSNPAHDNPEEWFTNTGCGQR